MAYKITRKKRYVENLVAIEFLELTERKEDALKYHPFIGAYSGIKDVRSLHITKHNRMFYRIVGKKVVILNLYDTRKRTYQKPA